MSTKAKTAAAKSTSERKPRRDGRFKNRLELLDFLLEVSTATSSTLDLDNLLSSIAQFIRAVVPADLFAILLYSEKQRGLRVRYSLGYSENALRDLVIPLDEGITGVAASARMTINVGDVRSDSRYLSVIDAVHSELAVPMTARGKLVGVIDIQSTKLNAFTSEDSALIQLIASRVAASLMNARLFRRVERQNRTLSALSKLSQEFSSTLNLDVILTKVATRIKSLINYDAFSILLHDESSQMLRNRTSLRFDQRVQLDNIPIGKGITGNCAKDRKPIRVEDTLNDPRYIETNPGIRSEICVPLLLQDRLVGVMDLESDRVGYFTEDHQQTLMMLAPMVSNAIENGRLYEEVARRKERIEADLSAARSLQAFLLPKEDPDIPGLEIGIGFRPAHEISGDVFDFFEQGSDHAVISFGDVSGKSAAAALYGAMVTGLLRTLAPRRRRPSELMLTINDALMERHVEGKYLTLLVALWQPKSGILTLSNAAAVPPMVLRDGRLIEPKLEGFPLGLFPGRIYEETEFQTHAGDLILFYSDGIQDQPNPEKKEYGHYRLREFLPSVAHLPARQIVDAIFADFDRYRGRERILDDQTLIAMRVKEIETDLAM